VRGIFPALGIAKFGFLLCFHTLRGGIAKMKDFYIDYEEASL
jgi:hypothetical protein